LPDPDPTRWCSGLVVASGLSGATFLCLEFCGSNPVVVVQQDHLHVLSCPATASIVEL